MKQRISKDLIVRRYLELVASQLTKREIYERMGFLLLKFYGIVSDEDK